MILDRQTVPEETPCLYALLLHVFVRVATRATEETHHLDLLATDDRLYIQVKLKLLYVYMFSMLLYARETWTLKWLDRDRLLAINMKCHMWILHIQWQQKVRNEVKKRIGANRNVFQIIIQKKTSILWPHLPDEERTNVKSHSVWCDGGQSTESETMSRMDG